MIDAPAPTTPPARELRQFGFVLGGGLIVIFGLLFPLIRLLNDIPLAQAVPAWPWIAALVIGAIGIVAPATLGPVWRVWMKIGHVLGWINTRILLGIVFLVIFFPLSLLFRLFGKDPMARGHDAKATTYRVMSHAIARERLEKPF